MCQHRKKAQELFVCLAAAGHLLGMGWAECCPCLCTNKSFLSPRLPFVTSFSFSFLLFHAFPSYVKDSTWVRLEVIFVLFLIQKLLESREQQESRSSSPLPVFPLCSSWPRWVPQQGIDLGAELTRAVAGPATPECLLKGCRDVDFTSYWTRTSVDASPSVLGLCSPVGYHFSADCASQRHPIDFCLLGKKVGEIQGEGEGR